MKKYKKCKLNINQSFVWSVLLFFNLIYTITYKFLLQSFVEPDTDSIYKMIYEFIVIPILFLSSSAIVGLLVQPILQKPVAIKRKKIYKIICIIFTLFYFAVAVCGVLKILPENVSTLILKLQVLFLFLGAFFSISLSR